MNLESVVAVYKAGIVQHVGKPAHSGAWTSTSPKPESTQVCRAYRLTLNVKAGVSDVGVVQSVFTVTYLPIYDEVIA
jgi:hypothetical protein